MDSAIVVEGLGSEVVVPRNGEDWMRRYKRRVLEEELWSGLLFINDGVVEGR